MLNESEQQRRKLVLGRIRGLLKRGEVGVLTEIELEDSEELAKWGMGLERIKESCVICKRPTRFWYMPTNQPCCPDCALESSPEDFLKG